MSAAVGGRLPLVRAFVTGATGFIGSHVARRLRDRGDDVIALVRSPSKAGQLKDLACELVEGDLSDDDALQRGLERADACFHIAAVYEVGVPRSQRARMFEANVRGTERVLDAAAAAGVPRTVHVSTINVFGNTRRKVVAEGYRRPIEDGFLSAYDETKYLAHEAALDRIRRGARIMIVQPGAVYGPGDTSQLGDQIRQAASGKLRFVAFADLGLNLLHVEDAAAGIVLAHDHGEIGETYVLGGEIGTLGGALRKTAQLAGRRVPPRLPTWAIRMGIPLGPVVGKLMGVPPNLREIIRLSDGVTYWAADHKARERLGYDPRPLERGLRETLKAGT